MIKRGMMAVIVAAGLASSAQAVSFFSVGANVSGTGAGSDPGLASYEQAIMSFQGKDAVGYSVNYSSSYSATPGTSGTFTYLTGNSGSVVAPAGDATRYMSVATNGSVLFDLRSYISSRVNTSPVLGVSLYVGSIDAGNKIELLGNSTGGNLNLTTPLLTITGSQMLGSGSGVDATNRRVYISFNTLDNVGALRFSSSDGSLEFDTVGATSQAYVDAAAFANGGMNITTPPSNIAGVPEPRSWLMMMVGFGLLGSMLRSRGRKGLAALS